MHIKSLVADYSNLQSRTYPNPYYQYSDFEIWTRRGGDGKCFTTTDGGYVVPPPFAGPPGDAQRSVSVLLNTTLYNAYPGTNIEDTLEFMRAGDADGSLPRKLPIEFYNYIRSNLKLLSLYPELKTCYQGVIFGAPSIKIRVSALTATDYTTIRSAGVYTGEIDQELTSETFNPVPPSLKPAPASIPKPPAGPTTSVVYPSQLLRPFSSENNVILSGTEKIVSDEFQAPQSSLGPKSRPLPVIVTAQEDVQSSKSGRAASPTGITLKILTAAPPIITIGPSVYTAESDLKYIIGSNTLAPGGPPLIVDNVPYALAPSATALIIGTQTIALSQATAQLVATIKNIIYTADSLSRLVIGSQTLIPDGPLVTIDNKPYYLASSFATATPNRPQNPPIQLYKPGPLSNYVIEDKTLSSGGPAIILSDIIYSLAPEATAIISKGTTIPLSPPARVPYTIINIGGRLYTRNPASNYFLVGSQTLLPGGNPISINRTPYALIYVPQGQALVIGSVTSFIVPTAISTKQPVIITLGSSIYTANAESEIVIGSQTLVPGDKAITIDHTPYYLYMGAFGAEGLVIGSSTTSFFPSSLMLTGNTNTEGHTTATTEAVNMGSLILRPFVGLGSVTATATATATPTAVANSSSAHQPVIFTGAGVMNGVNCWPLGICFVVIIIIRRQAWTFHKRHIPFTG